MNKEIFDQNVEYLKNHLNNLSRVKEKLVEVRFHISNFAKNGMEIELMIIQLGGMIESIYHEHEQTRKTLDRILIEGIGEVQS